jgi:hypothetical protein
MNVLDENMLGGRRRRLQSWGIAVRQIGYDLGRKGMSDNTIIPLLLQLRRPTFFTLDADYYKLHLRHARYCLVYLAVPEPEAPDYIRRVLRHPEFNTIAKRMGLVMRVSSEQINVWRSHADEELSVSW